MARNTYFSQGSNAEAGLYEDIIIEAIKIYGQDVFYLPRTMVEEDDILNETIESKFDRAYKIEMYVENTDGFEGDGDLLTKFGLEVRDEATLIVAKRTWNNAVFGTSLVRPNEGDLIYFAMTGQTMQIRFVENEQPFYQLKNLPVFRITVESFEYNDESIDTGITEIDNIESDNATQVELTMLSSGTGTYQKGEVVTAGDANAAEVASWDATNFKLNLVGLSDNFAVGDTLTGGTSGAVYEISSISSLVGVTANDEFADNDIFETIGNNFVDFSEVNPFGEI